MDDPPTALEGAAPSVEDTTKELVCAEEDVTIDAVAVLKEKVDPKLGAGDSGPGSRVEALALTAKAEPVLEPKGVGELATLTLALEGNPLKGLPDMIPDA